MNDLNAQQIVLLTLLISFVTSIATGIVTVSLLEQAPEPITQTINRVVEKTIERVIPENTDDGSTVKTPEKEIITKIVNQEDLTIDSVNKNSRSLARIYQKIGGVDTFIALGIVFDAQGRLVTDSTNITKSGKYTAIYQSGKFNLEVNYREPNQSYAILKLVDGQTAGEFSPATFADSQSLKLAQSVISLSGINSNTVSSGIITNLQTEAGKLSAAQVTPDANPEKQITLIETSVDKNNVLLGSIILNLNGEIIGAKIGGDYARLNVFTPSNVLINFLNGK